MILRQILFFVVLATLITFFSGVASAASGFITMVAIFVCLWWAFVFFQYFALAKDDPQEPEKNDDDDDFHTYQKWRP